MRLAVTGANGFLGRYVVAEALRRGHQVVAIVRPAVDLVPLPWHDHPSLAVARTDLRRPAGLAEQLVGVDAVAHLAAVKGGDVAEQFAGTVVATENLLAAMDEAGVDRLVQVSTFSVYDQRSLGGGAVVDESTPLERRPADRDGYAQTKLLQEELVRRAADEGALRLTVLRPGIVYGRGELWHACLGLGLGSRFLLVGPRGVAPLTYVENCAEAVVAAAERDAAVDATVNVVDDDLPTRRRFADALVAADPAPPAVTAVPWHGLRALAGLAWQVNQRILDGRALVPGILVPARVEARFGPRRYPNDRAKDVLGWRPTHHWRTAIQRSLGPQELLAVPEPAP